MVQDIPKLFTALAEWMSCVCLLIEYNKFMEKKSIVKHVMNMILQKQYMQFRMSQENIDLVNRKYHNLKHQI